MRAFVRVVGIAAAVLAALYYWSISAEGGNQFVTAVYHFAYAGAGVSRARGLDRHPANAAHSTCI